MAKRRRAVSKLSGYGGVISLLLLACGSPRETGKVSHTQDLLQCRDNTPAFDFSDSRDGVLFEGLSCLAGESESCDRVKRTVVTPAGPLCRRAPVGIAMDGVLCQDIDADAYSRDMLLGVLAYVLATNDVDALNAAVIWIEERDGQLSDNHQMNPHTNHLVNLVGQHVGGRQLTGAGADPADVVTWASASAATGYQAHLVGVRLHLMKHMGYEGGAFSGLDESARRLAERFPDNAYFHWLAGNLGEAEHLTLDVCGRNLQSTDGWLWQRTPVDYAQYSGSDVRFMINVLIGGN